jgi:hypothetical protein
MKNAISFASELRFLANLGFLKSLEKILQLDAEKHQEMSRGKILNMERCETFQYEEPVKHLNSKIE